MSLLDLPAEERPRERLAQKGASALSAAELIAILLGSGTKERSALDLASLLLIQFGSLERLSESSLQELLAVKGIKIAKAVKLMAAFQLGKRGSSKSEERPLIDTPEKALREVYLEMKDEKVEVLYLLLRDARGALLAKELASRGILNQVLMHPREVFHAAIRHRAHSLIIAHNHPSGDPSPSQSDKEMTRLLQTAGHVIGIPLVDHLIIGGGRYYSFWRDGGLDSKY